MSQEISGAVEILQTALCVRVCTCAGVCARACWCARVAVCVTVENYFIRVSFVLFVQRLLLLVIVPAYNIVHRQRFVCQIKRINVELCWGIF